MYNTMITVAVMLDAYLWLIVIDKIWCRLSERSERKTEERRERFRQAAYATQRQLKVIKGNRESLWAYISKE
jgi:hypothetical protein